MVSWGKEIRDGGFGVTEIRGTIAAKQGEEQTNPHEINQRQLCTAGLRNKRSNGGSVTRCQKNNNKQNKAGDGQDIAMPRCAP
jgi:hypothetical protein